MEENDRPESFVHSTCRLMSSSLTVGRTLSTALMKSFSFSGGSRSSSDSSSVQALSSASGSPGEQGVHFVLLPSDCGTGLKCVADSTFRTGCMRASRTTTAMSDPEYLKHGQSGAAGKWDILILTHSCVRPNIGSPDG